MASCTRLVAASLSNRWEMWLFTVASLWWVKWPLFLVVGTVCDVRRYRPAAFVAVRAALAVALAASVVALLKDWVDRARPDLAVVALPDSASFPSGHAATAFAAATAIGLLVPRLRLPLLALAAVVACSTVRTEPRGRPSRDSASTSLTIRWSMHPGRFAGSGPAGAAFNTTKSPACFARAAPIAVLTSFSSSGGGSTAGRPSFWRDSSRAQPCVW